MRIFAVAAAATALLALACPAQARPWTDPGGRLSFDAPQGWTVQQRRGTTPADTFTYVIAGNANNECQFLATPNPSTLATAPANVRSQSGEQARFTQDLWLGTLNSIVDVFRGGSAQVISTSVDTTGYWPIQRAEARSAERPVHASMQLRPGVDLVVVCLTYEGSEPLELYDQVIHSVGHPNDATWRAAADAAPTPAPAPAAQ